MLIFMGVRSISLSSPGSSPNPPALIRAWWASSSGYVTDLEPTPEVGGSRCKEGWVPVVQCTGKVPLTVRGVQLGDVHFSQYHCHPYPAFDSSAMVWADRKGFNKYKAKQYRDIMSVPFWVAQAFQKTTCRYWCISTGEWKKKWIN